MGRGLPSSSSPTGHSSRQPNGRSVFRHAPPRFWRAIKPQPNPNIRKQSTDSVGRALARISHEPTSSTESGSGERTGGSKAREQLRTAHDMFSQIGIPGFADRARRELAATGETPRKRSDDTRGELIRAGVWKSQQPAAEGMTNPEIGAKLFLSPRTIEWHLRNAYSKLSASTPAESYRPS